MDIEETKKNLKLMMRTFDIQAPNINVRNVETLKKQTIETALQELDNSISKDKVRELINQLYYGNYTRIEYNYRKKVLEELLEEK